MTGLMTSVAFFGLAAASGSVGSSPTEADAYCERTRNGAPEDYPGIGWFPEIVPADFEPAKLAMDNPPVNAKVMVCEGEHWDGQDQTGEGVFDDPTTPGGCSGQFVSVPNDYYVIAFNQCDEPADITAFDALNPVGVRASAQGDKNGLNNGAILIGIRVTNVGQAHLQLAGCTNAAGPAEEFAAAGGPRPCQGDIGHGLAGLYIQDDVVTPQDNVLARIVTLLRLTKGYVSDGDCTQPEYKQSAKDPNNPTCGRDNTAISVELLA